jgi:hypothetical protein
MQVICFICKKNVAILRCRICGIPVCKDCQKDGICLNCLRGKEK